MTNTNGRPTALTPDVEHRIIQALQLGDYRKDAAQYAGVDPTTLHRWVARGRREPDSEYGARGSVRRGVGKTFAVRTPSYSFVRADRSERDWVRWCWRVRKSCARTRSPSMAKE